jgi:beta-lactamase class A
VQTVRLWWCARACVRAILDRTMAVRVRLFLGLLACVTWPQATLGNTAARDYLARIQPSSELQAALDQSVRERLAADPKLRQTGLRVAVIDLTSAPPRLAHYNGDAPVYPASVVKFVYLMAAYKWREEGKLDFDPTFDAQLTEMIRQSSNQATRQVFARLTGTEPGPELPDDAYRDFRNRRLAVKAWLESLGITDLHCVNPTYDGNGDLFGRDAQFLRDRSVTGGLPSRDGEFANRQSMTAIGTAKLLALLATDRALSPEDSSAVRRRMRRDPREQPHLAARIAGGAARLPGLEVFAKSGTWGPIYADAGIVRAASGDQFVLAVYTDAMPPYRGDFIADLTERLASRLLTRHPSSASRTPDLPIY